MIVRPEQPADEPAIFRVNAAAFGGAAEAELVDRLRADGEILLSLVAEAGGEIVGHVGFSGLTGNPPGDASLAALAPVAVRPNRQRQGIGTALIETGIAQLTRDDVAAVFVLGEPVYYRRFGFSVALAQPIRSAYSGPYFMARELRPGGLARVRSIAYPAAFEAVS